MSKGSPRRFKTPEELSAAEHFERLRAQRRGQPEPKYETSEYRATRRKALRRAGLEEEADEVEARPLTQEESA